MKPCPTCGGSPAAHAYGANWLIRCSSCNATNGIVHNDEDMSFQSWDAWAERMLGQVESDNTSDYWRKMAERLKAENKVLGEALLKAMHNDQHGLK